MKTVEHRKQCVGTRNITVPTRAPRNCTTYTLSAVFLQILPYEIDWAHCLTFLHHNFNWFRIVAVKTRFMSLQTRLARRHLLRPHARSVARRPAAHFLHSHLFGVSHVRTQLGLSHRWRRAFSSGPPLFDT